MWWTILTAAWGADSALPWDFPARLANGDVRVLPIVALADPPGVDLETWIGKPAPPDQERVRRKRTTELGRVPREIGFALPGAVNGVLGPEWSGEFHVAQWPSGSEERTRAAIAKHDWDALASLGRAVGGDAVLVTWVTALDGEPLTAIAAPGSVVDTQRGPVVADLRDEPYLVTAGIGTALVTRDGEVCVRYEDRFEAILSARYDADRVGRDLARELAKEISLVWVRDHQLDLPLGGSGGTSESAGQ
jgi:hypothetical protein